MPGTVLVSRPERAEIVEPYAGCSGRSRPAPAEPTALEHRQFISMQQAFRASGGWISGDDLARLLRVRARQPISMLARWIVGREVVNLDWRSCTKLPLFQFDRSTLALRPQVSDVLRELTAVFDDWNLALWFAQPNSWLNDEAPVDVLDLAPRAVLDAARADRFIARG